MIETNDDHRIGSLSFVIHIPIAFVELNAIHDFYTYLCSKARKPVHIK